MDSKFRINKNARGYTVIQTTKNVYTNNKPRTTLLGTFNSKAAATKTMRLAKRLVR